ncbi:ABC transporter ATP-binding protein [Rothia santali]|uniref:ABC transporter ATP-binding protein n=1 Tax=Rothia santali TaxID=2949643 RepID=UPI0020B33BB4|nr:ABC transporter ATP-binding protein [Rothia santali]
MVNERPQAPGRAARYAIEGIRLGYGDRPVIEGLSTEIPDGSFTAVIGANGCGKSTLLRGLARLLRPTAGRILLDGEPLEGLAPKQIARRVGLLPQSATAPEGIAVRELVGRGRFPHQNAWHVNSRADEAAIEAALRRTDTLELAGRRVAELSGGQRQRVWAAMLLAQETEVLLLDEPTTYLDMAHQIEFLDLFARLNAAGTTIVAVLHDLNQAARYAGHLIALREGAIVAEGSPREVITPENLREIFGLRAVVVEDPETGGPLVVPAASRAG